MYLNKKDNIKIINLKDNYINNFNELFDIINNFPKLEKLTVIGNDKIKEEDVEEMKIKIKNKYNRNLKIILFEDKLEQYSFNLSIKAKIKKRKI